jgi:hypothetical protein
MPIEPLSTISLIEDLRIVYGCQAWFNRDGSDDFFHR